MHDLRGAAIYWLIILKYLASPRPVTQWIYPRLEFQWRHPQQSRLCCTFSNDAWVWPSEAALTAKDWPSATCQWNRHMSSPCMTWVDLWCCSFLQSRSSRPRSVRHPRRPVSEPVWRACVSPCSHTSKPGLFYRPVRGANSSCSRSTGSMLFSPSKRQITRCTGPWRTRCHAQVSVLLMSTVKQSGD